MATVDAAEVEEIKKLLASFGHDFHIKDACHFTGSHVIVYLYSHATYSSRCGVFSGKKIMVNGWDQTGESESYNYDFFIKEAKKELMRAIK